MRWIAPLLLLLTASRCLAAEPFARAEIEHKGKIIAGQQIRLDVTVFAPDFFTSPPQFPLFDLPNAVVTLPDERAQNVVETVDGIQYSGIRRVYAIVPERSGDFSLPSVAIELGYSVDGKAVKGQALAPPFHFTVDETASSTGNTLAFAARNLTLEQSFDRDPSSLKVGEALVRTITVFAEDTQAMMIPAINVGVSIGLKRYDATSVIQDNVSVERRIGSRRTQTLTYTVDATGSFTIPGISYGWYDLDAHHQSIATLPSTTVKVELAALSADRGIAPQLQAPTQNHSILPEIAMAGAIILLTMVGWLIWRFRTALFTPLRRRFSGRRNSDRRAFRDVITTIRTGTPKEIEKGLRSWSSRKGYASLTDWISDNAALRVEVERLQRCLYDGGKADEGLDRKALERAVGSFRQKVNSPQVRSYLPTLNPEYSSAPRQGS